MAFTLYLGDLAALPGTYYNSHGPLSACQSVYLSVYAHVTQKSFNGLS
jgi:hypothetical protein